MEISSSENSQEKKPSLFSTIDLSGGRGEKLIRFYHGDMTETDQDYDIVCCSAYKGAYGPTRHSLIGALYYKRGISVQDLAVKPVLDMRDEGGWISQPVNKQFGRILCVELIDRQDESSPFDVPHTTKSAYLSLRSLVERAADIERIEICRIALPILGAGYQDIGIEYIAPTLFNQCMIMFKTVQTLKTIDFYELELWKLKRLVSLCNDIYEVNLSMKPSVFISYASEQDEIAHAVWANLQERGIQTWIYKESVPAGSNYLDELPKAIDSIEVMVLLLSEEAQESPWVQREVGCAVDENKVILPFQLSEFPLNVEMKFLLKNSQIKSLWKEDGKNKIPVMVREVVKRLDIT